MRNITRLIAIALLLLLVGIGSLPGATAGAAGDTNFTNVVTSGTLTVNGITSLVGAQTFTGNTSIATAVIGTDLRLTPSDAISVTNDAIITPTAVYQPLESAGNVGTAGIAVGAAGDILYLVNTTNTTITLTDTGTLLLSGNTALGQYDTLLLFSDGTNWIEVAQTNN